MWTGMKFFHLSDLHIGKQLHRYNLKEDQQVILKAVSYTHLTLPTTSLV